MKQWNNETIKNPTLKLRIGFDIKKFTEKGNKAAGTRSRKTLQEIKKVAQQLRLEIQDVKKKDTDTKSDA